MILKSAIQVVLGLALLNGNAFGGDKCPEYGSTIELIRNINANIVDESCLETRNEYGRTLLMEEVLQGAESFQLMLRMAPHQVTQTDIVGNNILHMAFPLPEEFFGSEVEAKAHPRDAMTILQAVLSERSVSTADKIAALTQKSHTNFTPVSLAEAMHLNDIHNFLVTYLKSEGAWNPKEHKHLPTL